MKRIKVKPRCVNPLFVEWLEEWKAEAASRGSSMQYCFSKALVTMKKCPLELKRGRDCLVLKNFGPELCGMLDKKLAEHEAKRSPNNGEDPEPIGRRNPFDLNANVDVDGVDKGRKNYVAVNKEKEVEFNNVEPPVKKVKTPEAKGNKNGKETSLESNAKKKNRNTGPYIPAWRSGGYAILLSLLEKTYDAEGVGSMRKTDIQTEGQKYCDESLKKPLPGNRYSAWSSMSKLIEKGLVIKYSNPALYKLTRDGYELALKLSMATASEEKESTGGSSVCDERSNIVDEMTSKGLKSPAPIHAKDKKVAAVSASSSSSSFSVSPLCIEIRDCDDDDDGDDDDGKNSKAITKKKDDDLRNGNWEAGAGSKRSCDDKSSLVLHPHNFDVILIVDDRETAGGKVKPKDDATIAELTRTGIKFEVKNLKIGDFAWIARSRKSGEELVLPYIVERKRIDDLSSSIKDGRYHEQKFRLKRSGLPNVTYLVENHGNNQYSTLPINTLFQAAINTLVQDGFIVKWTDSHKDSMIYLSSMTEMLSRIYKEKTLVACKKENLSISDVNDEDSLQLMYFEEFNKAAAKVKTFECKHMFIRQLIQLRGVSVERAIAIVDLYPTPLVLKKAFDKTGENLLTGIRIGRTQHQFGPTLSKTLHQFYTEKDF